MAEENKLIDEFGNVDQELEALFALLSTQVDDPNQPANPYYEQMQRLNAALSGDDSSVQQSTGAFADVIKDWGARAADAQEPTVIDDVVLTSNQEQQVQFDEVLRQLNLALGNQTNSPEYYQGIGEGDVTGTSTETTTTSTSGGTTTTGTTNGLPTEFQNFLTTIQQLSPGVTDALGGLGGISDSIGGISDGLGTYGLGGELEKLLGQAGGLSDSLVGEGGLGQDIGGLSSALEGLFGDAEGIGTALEGINFGGLEGQVSGLEQRLSQIPGLGGLEQGIGSLESRLGNLFSGIPNELASPTGTSGFNTNSLISGLNDFFSGDSFAGDVSNYFSGDGGGQLGIPDGLLSSLGGVEQGLGSASPLMSNLLSELQGFNPSDGFADSLSSFFSGESNPLKNLTGGAAIPDNLSGLLSGLTQELSGFTPSITNINSGLDSQQMGQIFSDQLTSGRFNAELQQMFRDFQPDINARLTDFFAGPNNPLANISAGGISKDDLAGAFAEIPGFDNLPAISTNFSDVLSQLDPSHLFGENFTQGIRGALGIEEGQSFEGLLSEMLGNGGGLGGVQPTGSLPMTDDQIKSFIEQTIDGSAQISTGAALDAGDVGGLTDDFTLGAAQDEFGDFIFDQAILDQPEITDFSDFLKFPLMDGLVNALGTANPFDTRKQELTAGPQARIDQHFDEARENLEHRFGVLNNFGSPAAAAQMRKLENDRALANLDVDSQFGLQAAQSDEMLRRNRLSDLSSALGSEFSRTQQSMNQQAQFQQQADQGLSNFIAQQQAAYMDPLKFQDEGLRLQLGGLGSSLTPNVGAATTGLGNISTAANNAMASNSNSIGNAVGGLGDAFGQAFTQGTQPAVQSLPQNKPLTTPLGVAQPFGQYPTQ